ncbi:hypothetical protein [Streptomyces mirabilis]|uniref:hypothetical protein n=1 Tax=Streptomyces mirabilis TaxID=68239 RepID=UPI00367A9DAA
MADQNWGDDTEYHRAVGRAWVMVAVASCCSVVAVGFVLLAVFGVGVFVALVNALGGWPAAVQQRNTATTTATTPGRRRAGSGN